MPHEQNRNPTQDRLVRYEAIHTVASWDCFSIPPQAVEPDDCRHDQPDYRDQQIGSNEGNGMLRPFGTPEPPSAALGFGDAGGSETQQESL